MIYFKFKHVWQAPPFEPPSRFISFLENCCNWLLPRIIPKANPDFEDIIPQVCLWYIEYNETEDYVEREIGIDDKGQSIMKAPYLKNIGFWCDSDMTLNDYKRFPIEIISSEEFEDIWKILLLSPKNRK